MQLEQKPKQKVIEGRQMKRWGLLTLFVVLLTVWLWALTGHAPLVWAEATAPPLAAGGFDCTAVVEIPQIECEALVAFYHATGGPNWDYQGYWLLTDTPCSWYGIFCEGGQVDRIELTNNNLLGVVPPEIDNLDNLMWLWLNFNQLTAVPPEIGNLGNLTSLNMDSNQLTAVPPEIGNLGSLTALWLIGNQLTAVPPEIGNLESLTELGLANNQLTAVPPEIGNLGNLTRLSLDSNQLTAVPPEIGNLGNLARLYLNNNQLTAVPPEIGNLGNLTAIWLVGNQLAAIPPEIGNLGNLTLLSLGSNQLTAVPPEIGNLDNLTDLWLDANQLMAVPPEIGNLGNLTLLSLGSNQLTAVPPEIGNLGNLTSLNLENNQLTAVPPEIGNLGNLTSLTLSSNQLTAIPPQIGNLTHLEFLDVSHNLSLTGPLPDFLTTLVWLQYLSFGDTQWCVPPIEAVTEWLNSIPSVFGTGLICGGVLDINYSNGASGSFFTVTGSEFQPVVTATVSVNGTLLGSVATDEQGNLTVLLDTAVADEGIYVIVVTDIYPATDSFRLDAAAPLRPQEGTGPIFAVPAGIALTEFIYIPVIMR